MPYLTTETYTDEFGVVQPKGIRERVDLITNPLAIINRTIPMVMFEGSVTFILDRARKHAATLETQEEQKEFMFDVIGILNPKMGKELNDVYDKLSDYKKKKFIEDCISLNRNGTLYTGNGLYLRWEPFNKEWNLRDVIINVYEKYGDIFKPYSIFVPKPKWGRDIYIGDDYVGFQYIMMLKQDSQKGFSARSATAVSEEGLPEKDNAKKASKSWHSGKPIRFGELTSFRFSLNSSNCGELLLGLYYQTITVM